MMRGKDIVYGTGGMAESPGEMITSSRAGILASTIAWADANDIPLDQALLTATDTGREVGAAGLMAPVGHLSAKKWSPALEAAIIDLRQGCPLHLALRRHLHRYLPEYFLATVEKAEGDRQLADVMPHFARRLNFVTDIKARLLAVLYIVLIEMLVIVLICSFLCILIVPKFMQIFAELCEGLTPPMQIYYGLFQKLSVILSAMFRDSASEAAFYLVVIVLGIVLVATQGYRLRRFLDEVIIRIPWLGRPVKSLAVLELTASMASYLAVGKGMAEAAEFSAATAKHAWMREKAGKFAAEVRQGRNWAEAWHGMRLGFPMVEWLVQNAADRDRPVEGFDAALAWLCQGITTSSLRHACRIEVAGIMFNGLLVMAFGIAMLGSLFKMIAYLAEVL
jgi:type II secretory pathway component PulF